MTLAESGSMDERLVRFVTHARQRGMDFATLRAVLRDAGWKTKQVDEVLCEREVGMAVPQPTEAGSARDTFLHLFAFSTLYAWVISLTVLWFRYINLALPEPAWEDSSWAQESARLGIRWSLATLVVAYPLFLVLWRSILRGIARQPERAASGPRRWLTYLSLFIGAITILSDVITLVFYLFEGELTLRFVLKVVVLFVIAAAVFLYLLLTLRERPEPAA
jgi:hypothetical protein